MAKMIKEAQMHELNTIKEQINKGESLYIEFKEFFSKANDIAAEIVAFANSEGGDIFFGIADNGEIKGIDTKNLEEYIVNICRNNCIPNIIPLYREYYLDGKTIAVVSITKGKDKPYSTSDKEYYIRVGTSKRTAIREELMRLFQASGIFHYDITAVPGTSIKDLNINLIRDYFKNYNTFDLYEESDESINRILINADILKEGTTPYECSVGGLLIFGRRIDKFLPQSGISFAHFNGNDISEDLIDKKQIVGNLPEIVEHAMIIIKNNIKTPSTIIGAKRIEKEIMPDIVIREALVNALIHRNYSISGSKVRIFMFDDRIEFHSPGRLPNTVTVDKMKIGVTYARNPFLVKYMENLRYIDHLGRGIPMIFKKLKDLNAPEPTIEEKGEELILTCYFANKTHDLF